MSQLTGRAAMGLRLLDDLPMKHMYGRG